MAVAQRTATTAQPRVASARRQRLTGSVVVNVALAVICFL